MNPNKLEIELRSRVLKGMNLLNALFDGDAWMFKLDLEKLNLRDGNVCVCGQLFDSNWDGFNEVLTKFKLPGTGWKFGLSLREGEEDLFSYDTLTRVWNEEILKLKADKYA